MKKYNVKILGIVLCMILLSCKDGVKVKPINTVGEKQNLYQEAYRPQFHFSPPEKWMNDPNGLVYNQGVYHLFYQYYPEDIVWGPMHWGHAISKDMVHWENKPIALFPDEHGYIFSGSAVLDTDNSSGFGSVDNPPLVAIFTYHKAEGAEEGRNDFQTQGIAYSLDNGDTWVKYEDNPVIKNEGIKDFRDPKVFWNDKANNWTMLLVAGDHLQIWQSQDLKDWDKVSEFGKDQGAHGGVWECPDLFPLKVEGTDLERWVLLISINPGAPNGGSGTQYFIGDFDGKTFTSDQKEHKWIDWGTDNYAGVTYNNVPNNDRIFIGWMSNWAYAQETPTEKWRSAMTLPTKLTLRQVNNNLELFNYPLDSVDKIRNSGAQEDISIDPQSVKSLTFDHFNSSEVKFKTSSRAFSLDFHNSLGEILNLNLDAENQQFVLDRSRSGKVSFDDDFIKNVQTMPVPNLPSGEYEVRIFMDWSSVEIFINGGQYVMTAQIFPNEYYKTLVITNPEDDKLEMEKFSISPIKSIW
ncbi:MULTISPECIES: glycoside hydrolase family 32 protein [Arenibacter]|uniref:glycoside hydrolase family 32 protein n=1 Tax=Arenibacter TaxID=178469 RepID=UPI001EFDEB43|nr:MULTISPECIES: glycoside hydrolase family 32 protein [Arenibacter]